MENLVSNSKYFKFNPKINWEPVDIRKNRDIKPRFKETSLFRGSSLCLWRKKALAFSLNSTKLNTNTPLIQTLSTVPSSYPY